MRRFLKLGVLLMALQACNYSSEPVIAKVGKLRITKKEFRRKLSEVSQGYQNYVLTPNGRRQFLDVLIREKIKLAAAMDSDVPKSPEFKEEMEGKLESEEAALHETLDALARLVHALEHYPKGQRMIVWGIVVLIVAGTFGGVSCL